MSQSHAIPAQGDAAHSARGSNLTLWAVLSGVGLTLALLLLILQHRPPANFQQSPDTRRGGGSFPSAGFRDAANLASPAVVSILSSKTVRLTERDTFPLLRDYFGRDFDVPRQYRERGLGSGVIVAANGYVITNEHVVNSATDIRIILADKREFRANVVGTDPKSDIAVLKVDAQKLPSLPLSDTLRAEVGDIVLAIGNPFGVGQSVTMGIVSATARSGVVDPERYEDFIQTDAAINPGNSGGALITASGELIAINTAIISRSGGNQGIGFAIPAKVALHVMEHLIKDGRVIRGWLGVSIQPVDSATAKAFGRPNAGGALVSEVTAGSPAEKAGIVRGDIIVEWNGAPVAGSAELRSRVAMADPKTVVTLRLFRDGRDRTVSVTLGELREQPRRIFNADEPHPLLEGLELRDVDRQAIRQLGLPPGSNGALVDDVQPGTPAADAGLRPGDLIVEVDRRRVSSASDARAAISGRDRSPVILLIHRAGNTLYVVIEAH